MKYKLKYEIDDFQIDDPTTGIRYSDRRDNLLLSNSVKGTPNITVALTTSTKIYTSGTSATKPANQRVNLGEGTFGIIYECTNPRDKVVKLVKNTTVDQNTDFLSEVLIPQMLNEMIMNTTTCNDIENTSVCVVDGYRSVSTTTGAILPGISAILMTKYDGDGDSFLKKKLAQNPTILPTTRSEYAGWAIGNFTYEMLRTYFCLNKIGFVQSDFKLANCLYKEFPSAPYVRFYMSDFGGAGKKVNPYENLNNKVVVDILKKNVLTTKSWFTGTPGYRLNPYVGDEPYGYHLKNESFEVGMCIVSMLYALYTGNNDPMYNYFAPSSPLFRHSITKIVRFYDDIMNDVPNTTGNTLISIIPRIYFSSTETMDIKRFVEFVYKHLLGYLPLRNTVENLMEITDVNFAFELLEDLIKNPTKLIPTNPYSILVQPRRVPASSIIIETPEERIDRIFIGNLNWKCSSFRGYTGPKNIQQLIDILGFQDNIITELTLDDILNSSKYGTLSISLQNNVRFCLEHVFDNFGTLQASTQNRLKQEWTAEKDKIRREREERKRQEREREERERQERERLERERQERERLERERQERERLEREREEQRRREEAVVREIREKLQQQIIRRQAEEAEEFEKESKKRLEEYEESKRRERLQKRKSIKKTPPKRRRQDRKFEEMLEKMEKRRDIQREERDLLEAMQKLDLGKDEMVLEFKVPNNYIFDEELAEKHANHIFNNKVETDKNIPPVLQNLKDVHIKKYKEDEITAISDSQKMKFEDDIEFLENVKSPVIEMGEMESENKYKFMFGTLTHKIKRFISKNTYENYCENLLGKDLGLISKELLPYFDVSLEKCKLKDMELDDNEKAIVVSISIKYKLKDKDGFRNYLLQLK